MKSKANLFIKAQFLILNSSFLIIISIQSAAQVIPDSMRVNWSYAGVQSWYLDTSNVANVKNFGAMGDSITDDYASVVSAINSLGGRSGIVFFPAGNYLIGSSINLPDSVTLEGEGAAFTSLTFNFNGATANSINIQRGQSGSFINVDSGYTKGSYTLFLANTSGFNKGDYAELLEDNGSWDVVPASWAANSVGQIVQIDSVSDSAIYIAHALRIDYDSVLNVRIQKINPVFNASVECMRLTRVDSAAQSVNYMVYFNYAVNCRMVGVESDHSICAHVWAEACTSLEITGSYFHDSYIYDGVSTHGYGVGMAVHSGEVKVENNIFRHLRHSMIAKQGANGNVYGYNYSLDPNRTEFPSNAGADMLLHGHYAFANLFEGNINQTAMIDSTWGPSGPYNTFFRNRIELYGLIMTAGVVPSDSDNFVGLDITSGIYYLTGTGHFTYGNNDLGTITPAGTSALPDSTYYLSSKPSFWNIAAPWPNIGTPYDDTNETNPAYQRYLSGTDLTICEGQLTTGNRQLSIVNCQLSIAPDPFTDQLSFTFYANENEKTNLKVCDISGRIVLQTNIAAKQGSNTFYLDTKNLISGMYFVFIGGGTALKCVKE